MSFDAFWLPAIESPSTTSWRRAEGEGPLLDLRVPLLDANLLDRQIDSLLRAKDDILRDRPLETIVQAIDRVAGRLLDPSDPVRKTAAELLPMATGLSPQMTAMVLDGMAADWRKGKLDTLLAEEFGNPEVLDGFADLARGRRAHAIGPRLAVHVFSGNVPGVAVTSLIRSLLVKAPTLGKTATGEPVLAPLFAQALAEEDPGLGSCLAIAYWPGGDEVLEPVALSRAEAVIGYGSSSTIEALRGRVPAHTRFLAYGNRLSFAVIAREAMAQEGASELAASAALAVAMFDQQGCVSPHLIYVEEGGKVEPREWARLLATEMALLEERLPRGTITPEEAARIRQIRGEAEFARLGGKGHEVHASPEATAWTVLYDPEPDFQPSCLNRTIRVSPISSLDEIIERVGPLADVLQTVGVAGPESRLRPLAMEVARLGVTRLTPLGRMPWPAPAWHHDGRPPLGDLVRWCDWE